MNRLGFTGTRIGMTQAQRITLAMCLATLEPSQFSHGDCVGADEQAHGMALIARVPVHIYPPHNEVRRAFCEGAAIVHAPGHYHERDRWLVDASDILIATPKRPLEELRSGTWTTIRYARRQRGGNRKHVIVINPDGTTT